MYTNISLTSKVHRPTPICISSEESIDGRFFVGISDTQCHLLDPFFTFELGFDTNFDWQKFQKFIVSTLVGPLKENPWDKEQEILKLCRNPQCINPNHFKLGSGAKFKDFRRRTCYVPSWLKGGQSGHIHISWLRAIINQTLAHRVYYQLFIGRIPSNLYVCHRCSNSGCLNPYHLYLGTHTQNTRDLAAYRRAAKAKSLPKLDRGLLRKST